MLSLAQHPDGAPLHGFQRPLLAVAPAVRGGRAHGQGGQREGLFGYGLVERAVLLFPRFFREEIYVLGTTALANYMY